MEATRRDMPTEISSPTGKLVYLYLDLVDDGATVEELGAALDLDGLTVFGVLDALHEKSVVERRGRRYVPA